MPSRDILDKLLGVEQEAEALVGAAAAETEAQLSAAKAAAEAEHRATVDARRRRLEEGLAATTSECEASLATALADFRKSLGALPETTPTFVELCGAFFTERS